MIVTNYEYLPDGSTRQTIDWAASTSDHTWFGLKLYAVSGVYKQEAIEVGLVPVHFNITTFSWWCARPCLRTCVLVLGYRALPLYWRGLTWLWRAGLLEPDERIVFSWRKDFRPFPWRGRRRFKNG